MSIATCINAEGMSWDEARELDWDGHYPVLRVRCGEVIVDRVIAADEDTSALVPVYVRQGRMHDACEVIGWHDGFRDA
jgi:hypothetical protein